METESKQIKTGVGFKVGVFLLALNVPLGWGGAALCVVMAGVSRNTAWLTAGAVVYGASWVMLGLGLLLAGRGSLQYGRVLRKKWFKKRAKFES